MKFNKLFIYLFIASFLLGGCSLFSSKEPTTPAPATAPPSPQTTDNPATPVENANTGSASQYDEGFLGEWKINKVIQKDSICKKTQEEITKMVGSTAVFTKDSVKFEGFTSNKPVYSSSKMNKEFLNGFVKDYFTGESSYSMIGIDKDQNGRVTNEIFMIIVDQNTMVLAMEGITFELTRIQQQ